MSKPQPFPVRLFDLLEDPEMREYVSWYDDHSFEMHGVVDELVEKVVPRISSGGSSMCAVIRQLNAYGFSKERGNERWIFHNPLFVRGDRQSAIDLKRQARPQKRRSAHQAERTGPSRGAGVAAPAAAAATGRGGGTGATPSVQVHGDASAPLGNGMATQAALFSALAAMREVAAAIAVGDESVTTISAIRDSLRRFTASQLPQVPARLRAAPSADFTRRVQEELSAISTAVAGGTFGVAPGSAASALTFTSAQDPTLHREPQDATSRFRTRLDPADAALGQAGGGGSPSTASGSTASWHHGTPGVPGASLPGAEPALSGAFVTGSAPAAAPPSASASASVATLLPSASAAAAPGGLLLGSDVAFEDVLRDALGRDGCETMDPDEDDEFLDLSRRGRHPPLSPLGDM